MPTMGYVGGVFFGKSLGPWLLARLACRALVLPSPAAAMTQVDLPWFIWCLKGSFYSRCG